MTYAKQICCAAVMTLFSSSASHLFATQQLMLESHPLSLQMQPTSIPHCAGRLSAQPFCPKRLVLPWTVRWRRIGNLDGGCVCVCGPEAEGRGSYRAARERVESWNVSAGEGGKSGQGKGNCEPHVEVPTVTDLLCWTIILGVSIFQQDNI